MWNISGSYCTFKFHFVPCSTYNSLLYHNGAIKQKMHSDSWQSYMLYGLFYDRTLKFCLFGIIGWYSLQKQGEILEMTKCYKDFRRISIFDR